MSDVKTKNTDTDSHAEDNTPETGNKKIWADEEFDSERANTLVNNLRAENRQLKTQLRETRENTLVLESKVGELEKKYGEATEELAKRDSDLRESTKTRILAERSLPANLIAALNGDKEEEWVQMADMLSSLRGGDASERKKGYAPDPVQSQAKDPSGDASLIQEAKALGFM